MTFLAVVSIKAPGIKQSFQVMPQQNQQRNEIKKLHSAIHVESGLIASQIFTIQAANLYQDPVLHDPILHEAGDHLRLTTL